MDQSRKPRKTIRLMTAPMLMLLFSAIAAIPAFGDTTIGLPADHGGVLPFSDNYGGSYQQVYNHTQFSGPITITDLEFFNTFGASPTTIIFNFTFQLSTTSADWNTLSPTFAANLGSDNTTVFSGQVTKPWAVGDTLVLPLSTPFTYDPSKGNLLMTMNGASATGPGGDALVDFNTRNTFLGEVVMDGLVVDVVPGSGLVTRFGTTVPEPSTLLLPAPAWRWWPWRQRVCTRKVSAFDLIRMSGYGRQGLPRITDPNMCFHGRQYSNSVLGLLSYSREANA